MSESERSTTQRVDIKSRRYADALMPNMLLNAIRENKVSHRWEVTAKEVFMAV